VVGEADCEDDVLTRQEAAALLKLPLDVVRIRAEPGDLPGRRFGTKWRFARGAGLDWLTGGEGPGRRASKRRA
jgi:excisionase family DNA binding protein